MWNPRESRLDGKSHEAVKINGKIEKILLAVHSAFDSLAERKQSFDAATVKGLFQGNIGTQMTLLKLLDRHIEEVKARIGIDRAAATLKTYLYMRRYLSDFVEKKFRAKDIAFGQLSEQFIRDFQDFIVHDKRFAVETLLHYLEILKKICKIAYKEGHSDKYYFAHFKAPKRKETTPKALSREDFEKLRDLVITEKYRSHILTKDLFLFACYTDTAYADVVSITRENLFTDDEDNKWLKYHRKKNDYPARVKLLPEAIALIELYKDKDRETLFPMQRYAVLRKNIKTLQIMANLSQDLFFHVARHNKTLTSCSSGDYRGHFFDR